MSGHNKWSQIKHKKAKEDAKRGKAFTKLIKEITIVAREGGGEPGSNPRLRTLLEKAKEINMPLENITRAIKRGTGELPGASYTAITYEGYGPFGSAVLIDALTDNKNRTVAELRHIFSSHEGSLGETGCVSWMFDRVGMVRATGNTTEEELLEKLIDFDVQDIRHNDDWFSITCDPTSVDEVKKELQRLGLTIESADIEWVAKNTIDLTPDQEEKAFAFLNAIQDHDDVKNVYTTLS